MSYGVVNFGRDEAKNRREFELARVLGLSNLSADPDPDPACFASLEKLTEEYGVTIAIHPHGPGHRWGRRDQLDVAFKGRSNRIGLCGDTGHLIRAGEDPLSTLRAYADRLHAIHLKDFKKLPGDNKWQDVPAGDATLDVEGIIHFLMERRFPGGVFIEYEGGNPIEAIQASLARVAKAAG
jgi:sugar phosphate isomerase/epimerase